MGCCASSSAAHDAETHVPEGRQTNSRPFDSAGLPVCVGPARSVIRTSTGQSSKRTRTVYRDATASTSSVNGRWFADEPDYEVSDMFWTPELARASANIVKSVVCTGANDHRPQSVVANEAVVATGTVSLTMLTLLSNECSESPSTPHVAEWVNEITSHLVIDPPLVDMLPAADVDATNA